MKKALTLIEVLVGMVILVVGVLGVAKVISHAIIVNEKVKRHLEGEKLSRNEVENITSLGFDGINTEKLGQEGYVTWENLEDKYKFNGIPQNLDRPYDFVLYKGVNMPLEIGKGQREHLYLLRLSVQEDFGNWQQLNVLIKRLRLENYWLSEGNLTRTEIIFFVSHR